MKAKVKLLLIIQALQQLQALNGFASTTVTTPPQHQPPQPTANPYQGAGLSSATTATAQPATAVNLLTLQQLLAANGTSNLALANGAQGKQQCLLYFALFLFRVPLCLSFVKIS